MTWIKWSAEYPRPWWRRLLGLPAKRVRIFTGEVEPWVDVTPGSNAGRIREGRVQ